MPNIRQEDSVVAGSQKMTSSIPAVVFGEITIARTEKEHPPTKHTMGVDSDGMPSTSVAVNQVAKGGNEKTLFPVTLSSQPKGGPPIHRLPNEMLTEIFLYVCPNIAVCSKDCEIWDIEEVCQRWHALVLSTPELWYRIYVKLDLPVIQENSDRPMSYLLESALSASKNRPLSVKMQSVRFETLREYPHIFEDLWAHCARWESVDFTSAGREVVRVAPLDLFYPALKELSFQMRYDDSDGIYDFEDNAPQLTRVRVLDSRLPTCLKLPWTQLTLFEWSAYPFDMEEYVSVLKLMPKLEELIIAAHNIFLNSSDHVKLPHLRILRMKTDAQSLKRLLPPLRAPALKELILEHFPLSGVEPVLPCEPIIAFVSRSKCTLAKLSSFVLPPIDIFQLMPEISSLEHLELGQLFADPTATQALVQNLNCQHKSLLPNLRAMSLRFKSYEEEHSSLINLFHVGNGSLACTCNWCGNRAGSFTSRSLQFIDVSYTDKAKLITDEAITGLESKAKDAGVNITLETHTSGEACLFFSKPTQHVCRYL